jgi:hypothetical protein
MVMALALLVATAACTSQGADDGGSTNGSGDVIWDLTTARPAAELDGSDGGTEAIISTTGRNGVELRLQLPGGDRVDLPWGLIAALDGAGGVVDRVELSTTAETDEDRWQARIDEFVERFGGDREEIDPWVSEAVAAVADGDTVPGRAFDGEATATYLPSLSVRPGGGGPDAVDVVVEWRFDLL